MSTTTITATRGSDLSMEWAWTDIAGLPLDLTGGTAEIFESSETLADKITVVIANALDGTLQVNIEGSVTPLTVSTHWFRVRVTLANGFTIAGPKFHIRVE